MKQTWIILGACALLGVGLGLFAAKDSPASPHSRQEKEAEPLFDFHLGGASKLTIEGLLRKGLTQNLEANGNRFSIDSIKVIQLGAPEEDRWTKTTYYPFRYSVRLTRTGGGKNAEGNFEGRAYKNSYSEWVLDDFTIHVLFDWSIRSAVL
ncbi:hypothetical protein SAMN05444156_3096 [Verrucomicrobium sp. GAS474]|uniref:hypothetical protein n=1 Tax=Verrucomicrobium sp. GAS474 TaxID=1882831 RepID=UPI00087A0C0D|nr:hypothetical protein [Verrucomicrobium sp. GAS474]SDU28979.1 hypothetical protein SAMN05444156_3096 [Verrucomicrobium sp. GAS474]